MNKHYVQPKFQGDGFTCPHCDAFSAIRWTCAFKPSESYPLWAGLCHQCKDYSLWLAHYIDEEEQQLDGKMIYPDVQLGSPPNEDIPDDCRTDYEEARQIANKSPRAAAALLRLCIQKLCKELGEPGKNINQDIGNLVSKGLPIRVQQALDTVRIVGNSAVHPGELSVEEFPEVVAKLFDFVNVVVDNMITQPKTIERIYEKLPNSKTDEIVKRDNNTPGRK